MLTVAELQKLMARAADGDGVPGRRAHARGVRGRPHPRLRLDARRPGGAARRRHGGGAHRHRRLLLRRHVRAPQSRPPGTGRWASPTSTPSPAARRRGRRRACRSSRARTSPWSRWWPRRARACVRSRRPALATLLASARPPVVLNVEPSDRFAAGHVPGARWLPRELARAAHRRAGAGQAPRRSSSPTRTATTPCWPRRRSRSWATGRGRAGRRQRGVAKGGPPDRAGLTGVMRPPDDVVPAGPDRGYADMINYLRWEEKLGHKYGETHS